MLLVCSKKFIKIKNVIITNYESIPTEIPSQGPFHAFVIFSMIIIFNHFFFHGLRQNRLDL